MSKWTTAGIAAAVLIGGGVIVATQFVKKRGGDEETEEAEETGKKDKGDKKKSGKRKNKKGKNKRGKKKKGGGGKGDLESLGYLSSAKMREEDQGKVGVVRNEKDKVFAGLTIVTPASATLPSKERIEEATLYDMDGKILHKWNDDPFKATSKGWVVVRTDTDGYAYALSMLAGMVKLDWESKPVWAWAGRVHHDFVFSDDGLLVLVAQSRKVPVSGDGEGDELKIRDNGYQFLDKDGKPVGEVIWVYDLVKDDPDFKAELAKKAGKRERSKKKKDGKEVDIFHTNAVEILPRDIEGLGAKGDILTSIRNLNFVAVVDVKEKKIRWKWGVGELEEQHDPRLTPAGNVVMFDNGVHRKRSRAVEVSPAKKIEWTFDGGEERFFSSNRGMTQPLPNGNVLISISNEAKLVEVTRTGEIVWDFYSPRKHSGGRYPIRGVRISGPEATALQEIVDGKRPEPKAAEAVVVEELKPEDEDEASDETQ